MNLNHILSHREARVAYCLAALLCSTATADELTVVADRDNTIYEDDPGTNSNGSGSYIFAGCQGSVGWARRALVRFDLSGMAPGSTINSVELSLRVTQTIASEQPIDLHRVLVDWGEAGSDAPGEEGGGTPADAGDATWISSFHPSTSWTQSGGDFDPQVSASASVGATATSPTWSSSGLRSDVQAWVDGSASNFGWILKHTDEISAATAKRFASRENSTASFRPTLVVDFTPVPSEPGSSFCFGDGSGNACPCSNPGASGEGCANSTGSGSVLSGSGSNSISADDLVLSANNLTPGAGLFFQGDTDVNGGSGIPFGDGLRCAGGVVRRLEIRFANSGNNFTTTSTISVATQGAVSAGDVKRYQYWYRDSVTSPCSNLFNLSNAYQVAWSG